MSERWAEVGERGAYWALHLVALAYRLVGRTFCRAVLVPAAAYFYLTGGAQRKASKDFLLRAWRAGLLARPPSAWDGFKHFLTFSWAALDKFGAWTGHVRREALDGASEGLFNEVKRSGRGVMVLTAHVGNPEVMRAIGALSKDFRVNVLVHTRHAERFNRLVERFSPASPVRLFQVSEVDVGIAMRLSEAVSRGEWVVMTADRVAVKGGEASSVAVDFLGAPAPFASGPYILAAALGCPTYTLFCMQEGDRYRIGFELLAAKLELPRKTRQDAIRRYAAEFARRLERAVAMSPFQWFNFYDYWRAGTNEPRRQAESRPASDPAGELRTQN